MKASEKTQRKNNLKEIEQMKKEFERLTKNMDFGGVREPVQQIRRKIDDLIAYYQN